MPVYNSEGFYKKDGAGEYYQKKRKDLVFDQDILWREGNGKGFSHVTFFFLLGGSAH